MGCCQSSSPPPPRKAAEPKPAAEAPRTHNTATPAPAPATPPPQEAREKSPASPPSPEPTRPPPSQHGTPGKERPAVPRLDARDLSLPPTEDDIDIEEERLQEEFLLGYAQPYASTNFCPDDPSLGIPRDKEMEAVIFVEMLGMQYPRRQRADPGDIEFAN